jgi:hypothetical protein
MNTKFLSVSLKGRDHSEDLDVEGRIILEWILGKLCRKVWTGIIWLRIGTIGWLL